MSVYFITCRDLGRVKIGQATDPRRRFDHLQTGCPLPLTLEAVMPGAVHEERQLHERFASHRVHGEWFRLIPAIEAVIAAHALPSAPAALDQPEPIQAVLDRAKSAGIRMSRVCREARMAHSTVSRWTGGKNGARLDSVVRLNSAIDRLVAQRATA